jgi:folate-binding protein YgfZ
MPLRSPLHDRLALDGADFDEREGWLVARRYAAGVEAEYAAGHAGGVADRSARGAVAVGGRDAARLLQSIVTNEVEALAVRASAYALLLTPKGRPLADMYVLRRAPEEFLLLCEPAAHDVVAAAVRRYRLASRATVDDARGAVAALALLGGPELPPGELVSLAGPLGPELVGEPSAVGATWSALRAAGAQPVGADAFEILRVERGAPRLGAELDEQVLPAEAGVVERAVSFTKGCFIGQEPVARLHYRGHPNRTLRRLVFASGAPQLPATIELGGRDVGRVTSAASVPGAAARAVGLGYVRREVEDGSEVLVREAGGGTVPARLVAPA